MEGVDTAENEAAAESDIPALRTDLAAAPVGNMLLAADRNDFSCPLNFTCNSEHWAISPDAFDGQYA